MSDRLRDYIKSHTLPVPAAPAEEWSRSQGRVRQRRSRRVWAYGAAVTLSAAALLVVVNGPLTSRSEEARLEVDDLVYHEDITDRGAYNDWLWLTDSVDADE